MGCASDVWPPGSNHPCPWCSQCVTIMNNECSPFHCATVEYPYELSIRLYGQNKVTNKSTSASKVQMQQSSSAFISQSQTARSPGSRLHLAPLEHTGRRSTSGFTPGSSRTMRTVDRSHGKGGGGGSIHGNPTRATTKSAGSSVPDGTKSTVSCKPPATATETIQSAEFSMSVPRAPTPDPEDHIHNPELLLTSNSDCDDLSILPRPKKVLPKRELPWVFRYKVKKGMNTLSRIMASKPAPNALHTNYSFT